MPRLTVRQRFAVLLAVLGLVSAPSALAAGGRVLVVGDSLGVGSTPSLRAALHSRSLEIDDVVGRSSSVGLAALRQHLRPADRIIVFALGTNDDPGQPQALEHDLRAALRLARGRCLVIQTLQRPPVNGVSVDRLNAVVYKLAAGAPNIRVVDWRAWVRAHPDQMYPDHVHPLPSGYQALGQMVARAIRSC